MEDEDVFIVVEVAYFCVSG